MTARLIPKEEVLAYQRWDLGSIGDYAPRGGAAVRLPTAGEIQELHEQAIREGYSAGAAESQAQARRLAAVAHALTAAGEALHERLAAEVLDLALDIAAQVIRTALQVNRELLLHTVREAVAMMPAAQGEMQILVNPSDVELVNANLGDDAERARWKLAGDASIPPGGCRIQSAVGTIDATLGKRWERVVAALGADHAWLA